MDRVENMLHFAHRQCEYLERNEQVTRSEYLNRNEKIEEHGHIKQSERIDYQIWEMYGEEEVRKLGNGKIEYLKTSKDCRLLRQRGIVSLQL